MARQKLIKLQFHFFYKFGAHICHMTNTFMEKKLSPMLAQCYIYQKQKTESVYLILKNNYSPFSETGIFQKFR